MPLLFKKVVCIFLLQELPVASGAYMGQRTNLSQQDPM